MVSTVRPEGWMTRESRTRTRTCQSWCDWQRGWLWPWQGVGWHRTPESHLRSLCRSRIKFWNFGLRFQFIRLNFEPGLCETPAKILQDGALCRSRIRKKGGEKWRLLSAIPDGSLRKQIKYFDFYHFLRVQPLTPWQLSDRDYSFFGTLMTLGQSILSAIKVMKSRVSKKDGEEQPEQEDE